MKLRIGHVVASIGDLAAGTAHSVPQMCNALASVGHEVELHVLDYGGATFRDDAQYELHAYRRLLGDRRLGLSPEMHHGLRSAAKRLDILHWHGLWMMPNLYPHWATRGGDCKSVVSPRGMLQAPALNRRARLKRLTWKVLQGPAVRAAAVIHATSQGEADSIREMGLDNPIALVTNGIDVPDEVMLQALRNKASDRRRLLFLGRVHPIKGIDRVIRAWCLVQQRFPDWQFDIVGPDTNGYARNLQALGLRLGAQRLRFHGAALGVDRDRFLASAQLYVLASHSENFAMSVAESLAVGVPTICSRGTPWEQVVAESCGFWVDNTVESLAACLQDALAKAPAELAAMGARGRSWMQRSFAWRAKAEQMSEVYAWLTGSSPPSCLYRSEASRDMQAAALQLAPIARHRLEQQLEDRRCECQRPRPR